MKALESLGFVGMKDYKEYVIFHVFKGKNYTFKKIFAVSGIILLCLALIVVGFSTGINGFYIGAGGLLLGCVMFIYTINTNVKNACNQKSKVVRAKQKTVFGKNGFVFELLFEDTPEENEHEDVFFDELEAVYFAPKAIYLYIEKRSVVIIPKENLKVSSEEALEFLKKYLPSGKLVICK